MAHIRQLSADVIGQIAAGEVVERPAAAIKELVENSMDAGATAITVEIRDGGMSFFRVVDNGSGIEPSDIRLAFARHATSKITQAKDLYGVQTLGFRGEALASIAAVAKVTCTTRMRGAEYGVSVQNNGGEMGDIKEAACPEGTSFTVKDIFFNAPVRLRFLKKPATETGYVSDLMMRFILSHPQVSFRYIADGKTVYFSAGDGKLESAVMSIYGLSVLDKLHRVGGNMNGVLLDGFVGVGDLNRGNRSHQSFILNGRLIKSSLLTSALEEACRQRVMIGKFPMCVLHLTMPFEAADVNVHPNKWEVRFADEKAVREAVQTLIYDVLREDRPLGQAPSLFEEDQSASPVTVKRFSPERYAERQAEKESVPDSPVSAVSAENKYPEYANSKPKFSDQKAPVGFSSLESPVLEAHSQTGNVRQASFDPAAFTPNSFDKKSEPSTSPETPAAEAAAMQAAPTVIQEKLPDVSAPAVNSEQVLSPVLEEQLDSLPVRLIGVVFNTYILLECADRLLMCDQHAVHERLLYEQYMRDCAGGAATQMLLAPEIIRLTHREYEVFLQYKEVLMKAGFDADDFGDLSVQLRSIPLMLGQARSSDCFRDALDELLESGQLTDQKRTDRIIQMACKHAVKGGERAPMEALMELVRR
ncbi:MAG: DNA mismatch repair endonuclease MutL, partial [Clostridia bacterium]|nr:DNA mismatch repair endonuclease MutL [Clostridia bacterium]